MKWKSLIGKRIRVKFGCYNHPKQIEEGIVQWVEGTIIKIKRDDGTTLCFNQPTRKSDEVEILEG